MSRKLQKKIGLLLAVVTLVGATPLQAKMMDYSGHWAEKELTEWVEKGILSGYEDGSLKPNRTVTRAEFAKMLTEVFGLSYVQDHGYTDIVEGAWYEEYVALIASANMMYEAGNTFRPNEPITREEAAYAVATAYHIQQEGDVTFKDGTDIAEWAQEAVGALTLGGYIQGYEDNTFKPQETLTRAEAVTMLDKITAELINEAGTYSQTIDGNLVVNTTDVVLKDMIIKGNLYLAEGIGEGDVTLDHVTVEGRTIVEGGGSNSIELVNTALKDIVVNKSSGQVRVAADEKSSMESVRVQSQVQLEGKIDTIQVDTQKEVKLVGATINELKVVQADAKINIDKNTALETLVADAKVNVSGEGKIENAQINADEVKIEGVQIDKDKITVSEDVKEPPKVEVPSTSKPSGGGSSSDDSDTSEPVTKGSIKGNIKLAGEIAQGAEVVLYKMKTESLSTVVARTKTDTSGNYAFGNLDAGDYRLEIRYQVGDALYETSVDAFPVGKGTVTQDVDMEKKQATALVFTVEDTEGNGLEGAEVEAEAIVPGVTEWGSYGETDENGVSMLSSSYTFPVGTEVSYRVTKKGYETFEGVYTVVNEGTNNIAVELQVAVPEVTGTIQGTVTLGTTEEQLTVLPQVTTGAQLTLYKMISETSSTVVDHAVADENGEYTFNDVVLGDYRIEVIYSVDNKFYKTSVGPFAVAEGTTTRDIIIEPKEITALVFKVVDEKGEPVQDVEVYAEANVPGVTNWGDLGYTNEKGETILTSQYLFPVGTTVNYTVTKEGYETIDAIYETTVEGRNELVVVLK